MATSCLPALDDDQAGLADFVQRSCSAWNVDGVPIYFIDNEYYFGHEPALPRILL